MHRFVINATKQDKLLQVYKRQATKLNLNPTSVSIPYATLVPDAQSNGNINVPFEHTPTDNNAQSDLDQQIALHKGK